MEVRTFKIVSMYTSLALDIQITVDSTGPDLRYRRARCIAGCYLNHNHKSLILAYKILRDQSLTKGKSFKASSICSLFTPLACNSFILADLQNNQSEHTYFVQSGLRTRYLSILPCREHLPSSVLVLYPMSLERKSPYHGRLVCLESIS